MWGERGRMMEVVHERRLQSSPYCVARQDADQTKLQDALDWACGPQGPSGGGVDCSAILQTGSCYNPDTLFNHASYAFNYYYVKENGAPNTCDFGGVAMTTSTDPSQGSCVYPSLSTGVSSPSSNFSSPSPFGGSNNTFNITPTTGTNAGVLGPSLKWSHVCGFLLPMLWLVYLF
ncbi:hypothetical protein KP509_27G013100 [Ceratopteris richardii]|nr:hypothetical protein KP509_27G013100 [Ceratopteris richardii]